MITKYIQYTAILKIYAIIKLNSIAGHTEVGNISNYISLLQVYLRWVRLMTYHTEPIKCNLVNVFHTIAGAFHVKYGILCLCGVKPTMKPY